MQTVQAFHVTYGFTKSGCHQFIHPHANPHDPLGIPISWITFAFFGKVPHAVKQVCSIACMTGTKSTNLDWQLWNKGDHSSYRNLFERLFHSSSDTNI